jgi:hypothetical protein
MPYAVDGRVDANGKPLDDRLYIWNGHDVIVGLYGAGTVAFYSPGSPDTEIPTRAGGDE